MPIPSYEKFADFSEQVINAMECRRQEYRTAFFIRLIVVSAVLVGGALLTTQAILDENLRSAETLDALAMVCFSVLALLFLSVYLFLPVRGYRYKADYFDLTPSLEDRFPNYLEYIIWALTGLRSDGTLGNFGKKTLKEQAFTTLLGLGDFSLHGKRGISLHQIVESKIIPPCSHYELEDRIVGQINETHVELCEAKLLQMNHSQPHTAFQGMIILIDFSEVKLKLRSLLNGHTLLVADVDKEEVLSKLPEGWQNVALEDAQQESMFELFSTDEAEAQKLGASTIIHTLSDQLAAFRASQKQHVHSDRTIWNNIEKLSQSVYWLVSFEFLFKRIPSASDMVENEVDFVKIDSTLQFAAWRDKVVVTLPYLQNLFEPDSLFSSPPIHEEDLKLAYQLVVTLDTITKEIDSVLKS